MAPLPPSNTVRVYVDYTSAGIGHTAEFRMSGAPSESTMQAAALALINVMLPRMFDADSVTLIRYSPQGVDFTLPLPTTAQPGALVTGFAAQWAEDKESAMVSVVGRGSQVARRWRMCLFTPYAWAATSVNWPTTNRYGLGSNAAIDSYWADMDDWKNAVYGGSSIVTIGGDRPTMKSYVNIRKNSYWQDEQRT